MSGSKDAKGGRRRRNRLLLIPAGAGAVLLGLFAWAAVAADGFHLTIFQPDADDLLNRLVADSGLRATRIGDVSRMELDGTQPNGAMAAYNVEGSERSIMAAMQSACRRQGLGPADELHQGPDLNAICGGAWHDWDATVVVTTRCGAHCRAFVDVYLYPKYG